MAKKQAEKPYVVVTTSLAAGRGVFAGFLASEKRNGEFTTVVLEQCRNVLYWSRDTRGFLGLAVTGPIGESRVGPASPSTTLEGVTSITTCTPEAQARWESGPWT